MKRVNQFLAWLAHRSPFAALVVAGGMPDEGREKYLAYIKDEPAKCLGEWTCPCGHGTYGPFRSSVPVSVTVTCANCGRETEVMPLPLETP